MNQKNKKQSFFIFLGAPLMFFMNSSVQVSADEYQVKLQPNSDFFIQVKHTYPNHLTLEDIFLNGYLNDATQSGIADTDQIITSQETIALGNGKHPLTELTADKTVEFEYVVHFKKMILGVIPVKKQFLNKCEAKKIEDEKQGRTIKVKCVTSLTKNTDGATFFEKNIMQFSCSEKNKESEKICVVSVLGHLKGFSAPGFYRSEARLAISYSQTVIANLYATSLALRNEKIDEKAMRKSLFIQNLLSNYFPNVIQYYAPDSEGREGQAFKGQSPIIVVILENGKPEVRD